MARKGHEKEILAAMRADQRHPAHGTLTGYVYGCRCDRCRDAVREHREKGRVVPEEGAARRLEALMAAAQPAVVHIHGVGYVRI